MKLFALTSAAVLAASNAFAGAVAYVAPAAPVMIEEAPKGSMGGSGMWLIPLLAIALIALAVTQNNNEEPNPQPVQQ